MIRHPFLVLFVDFIFLQFYFPFSFLPPSPSLLPQMLLTPGGYDGSLGFLMLQVSVNLVLVIEVVVRFMSQKEVRLFFHFQSCSFPRFVFSY